MSTTRWTDFVNGATVITLVLSAISFLQVAVTTTNTVSASSSLKAAKEKLDEIDEIIKALNPEDHDKIEKLQPRLLVETRAEVNMLRKKVEKLQADLYSAKFT
ncbi:hypothetical protein SCP_0203930 [Sparassis crispa]|uniref:Uncharacterized protein n=1 Tax=Sparassis crispa TaxID=139825 RepID=A0A401GAI4_9APHY|nr:hypothetical protein SCP_0203930 [Sparassis crispa]GBE79196.1 hypothetical protein SCP_0203930 [Sparassis crispa]